MIEPIDESRVFTVDELFFSTTDLKGHIQRGNSVFQRIAGYSWTELKDKPHNIIRHPEMPRIVFQLLWDFIQGGRPVVAFVKNLAHDGRYYWVVALVTPIARGYLSVRFKPTSPLLSTVKQLYAELRAIEAAIESESNDRKAAIAASRTALQKSLRALGFGNYEDFMQYALKAEIQSRETERHTFVASAPPEREHRPPCAQLDPLRAAAEMFGRLVEVLNVLFGDLERFVDINKGVRAKSDSVTDTSESLRVSALNGVIAADKLGNRAAGLRPVLNWLRVSSGEITQEVAHLTSSLEVLAGELNRVVFGLCAAKLQVEMTAKFAQELVEYAAAGRTDANRVTEGAIESLHASSCETVRGALNGLVSIKDRLAKLTASQSRLWDSSHFLRPIYLTGKIEMAELAGSRLATTFTDVSDQLREIETNLRGLQEVLEVLEAQLSRGLIHGARIEETIAQIDSQMRAPTSR